MINWPQLLLELRSQYKPLTLVARELGLKPKYLQRITQRGIKFMRYEHGVKIIELHNKHVGNK